MEGLSPLASAQHHRGNVIEELRKDKTVKYFQLKIINMIALLLFFVIRELEETNSDEFHSVGIGRFKLAEVISITITLISLTD